MTNYTQYITLFHSLVQHKESEVVEFKKAERSFDYDDLGEYFSALSNEANLRGMDFAWLILGYDENGCTGALPPNFKARKPPMHSGAKPPKRDKIGSLRV